ncbi:hypothetical protein SAMN06296020_108171 [Anoxynatronum buryatiense]|uniref:Uncharacterized protein n=1 Tax=Anoxynatronum buryatiense TaxID=489973 RepID=A0AA45WWU4_9CLOT|nr:hypothetical protein SAMN06296020_108171 [Anoxynatronum buryatiense]
MVLGSFLPFLIFYVLDKLFNMKKKCMSLFKSTKSYRNTIAVISLLSLLIVGTGTYLAGIENYIIPFSMMYLILYLLYTPETETGSKSG